VLQWYRCEVIGYGIGDFKLWRRMFEPLHFSAWQGLVRIQQAIATMGRGQALLIRHSAGYELVATQLQLCEPAGDPMLCRPSIAGSRRDGVGTGSARKCRDVSAPRLAEPPAESDRADVVSELGGAERIAPFSRLAFHPGAALVPETCTKHAS
jgi:hypothetical protein